MQLLQLVSSFQILNTFFSARPSFCLDRSFRSIVNRHSHIRLGVLCIFTLPERCDCLVLRPEFESAGNTCVSVRSAARRAGRSDANSQLAIQRMTTQYGSLVPGPSECGHGNRDRDVDTDLSCFDVSLKVSCGRAVARKDRRSIAV